MNKQTANVGKGMEMEGHCKLSAETKVCTATIVLYMEVL